MEKLRFVLSCYLKEKTNSYKLEQCFYSDHVTWASSVPTSELMIPMNLLCFAF